MIYQSFTYSFKDNSNCLQLVNVQCKRYITACQLTVCVVMHKTGTAQNLQNSFTTHFD